MITDESIRLAKTALEAIVEAGMGNRLTIMHMIPLMGKYFSIDALALIAQGDIGVLKACTDSFEAEMERSDHERNCEHGSRCAVYSLPDVLIMMARMQPQDPARYSLAHFRDVDIFELEARRTRNLVALGIIDD